MRRLSLLLLALALLAAPRLTSAADDRGLTEARTRFQTGVQLFHEGSFDAALAEFRKAYQLAPSYRVLYNIAQVQFELRDYVGALKSFRQYLAEGGNDVPADRRAQVDGELAKLERRVSTLDIGTNVDGADILIDDVPVGTSPLRGPLLVNAGLRRITATKAGRVTTARSITVAGGDGAKVQIDLPELATRVPELTAAAPVAPPPQPDPPRTKMWVSLAATAALGIGTATFALLTTQAKNDFDARLATFPATKEDVDRARRRMALRAAITDGLGGATLVAAGLTIYFAVSRDRAEPESGRAQVRVAPTLGGLLVYGHF